MRKSQELQRNHTYDVNDMTKQIVWAQTPLIVAVFKCCCCNVVFAYC